MHPIDAQTSGPQLFSGLRYHIHIDTLEEAITFRDRTGHWLWEPATGLVLQSLSIPRGQAPLTSGHAKPDDMRLVVSAAGDRTNLCICFIDFLENTLRTDSYRLEVNFNPGGSWSYVSETTRKVRGRDELFPHRDVNTLVKVAESNPVR